MYAAAECGYCFPRKPASEFPSNPKITKRLVDNLKHFMYKRDPCKLHCNSIETLCSCPYIQCIDYKYPVRLFCVAGVIVVGLLVVRKTFACLHELY